MHILSLIEIYENVEYRGEHTAPTKETGNPLHNVSESVYPKDIYTLDLKTAVRYYGDGTPEDSQSMSIIQHYHNKPNKSIKIYRAIPKLIDKNTEILPDLRKLINYHNKFGFFPVNNPIINNYEKNFEHLPYDDMQEAIYDKIINDINDKQNKQEKVTINPHDWVTINKQYAINHGKHELNNQYKILTKTVKAKDIYTNGDSIHEWGYDP
jgi:hypothetical protein